MNCYNEPMAIIGSASFVPGAKSVQEYWDNISKGALSLSELPSERFSRKIYKSEKSGVWGKSHSLLAGLLDFSDFNKQIKPGFIHILQQNGVDCRKFTADSGQMLVSYIAYEALKSAGFNPFALPTHDVAVFTGQVRSSESYPYYQIKRAIPFLTELIKRSDNTISPEQAKQISSDLLDYINIACKTHSSVFEYSGEDYPHECVRRIQKYFKLEGPGFSFDNACSSSLAALYLAQRYLAAHPDGYALCGGISIITKRGQNLFSFNNANSPNGSHPFDLCADGLVTGEGCSFLLVQPLSHALASGNAIQGIIRGVGVSCDGRGKGLWAPSASGQTLAISRAMSAAKLDGSNKPNWVEAHATSTKLGDVTELDALTEALGSFSTEKTSIPVTSVKANIGHLLEAAGATSVIKVLQSLEHEVILPQAAFENPSNRFDWNNSPLYVPTKSIPWMPSKTKRRLALTDAFGIGGLNASVVVEGAESAQRTARQYASSASCPTAAAVAIVGIGCVLPQANNCEQFQNKMRLGDSALSAIPQNRSDLLFSSEKTQHLAQQGIKAGFINSFEYDWKRHNIPPKHIALAHPLQFWILKAVDEAIDAAGLPANIKESIANSEKWNRAKAAVVVGTMTDSDFNNAMYSADQIEEIKDALNQSLRKQGETPERINQIIGKFENVFFEKFTYPQDVTGGFSISTLGSRIAKSYDITGPVFSLDGGYSASAAALNTACSLLQDDEIETAICAAGIRSQGNRLDKYCNNSGQKPANPPAEGAIAFVLMRVEDALAKHTPIYAILDNISVKTIHTELYSGNNDNQTWLTDSEIGIKDRYQYEKINRIFGDFGPINGMVCLASTALNIKNEKTDKPVSVQVEHQDKDGVDFKIQLENPLAYIQSKKMQNSIESTPRPAAESAPAVAETGVRTYGVLRPRESKTRIAFLFAGQGAQYPNMMNNFQSLPGAEEIIARINASLQAAGVPDFKTVLQTEADKLGKDTFRTQLSLLIADTFIYQLYLSQGIDADILMGHSYGEYPAMAAAGVWSFQTAAQVTQKRCEAIEQALAAFTAKRTRTTMLSTNASEDQIEEAMASIPDADATLFVSNRNAPTQTIISGTYESIKKMEAFLLSHQRLALILPVPAAFHSPLVAGVCKPFSASLKPFIFELPTRALLSSVTSNFESDPDIFRSNLIDQMTKPVDFIGMIRKAYNNGCRRFVEIGPKKTLTNLAKQILSDCTDVTFYTTDNGKGGDPEHFLEICRQLKSAPAVAPATAVPVAEQKKTVVSAAPSAPIVKAPGISICRQSGSPFEMGLQYGKTYAAEIRSLVRRYVDIVGQASEKMLPPLPAMDSDSLKTRFGESGLEEMRGMTQGAGVPIEALIRHNICLFPTKDTVEQKKIYNAGKSMNSSEFVNNNISVNNNTNTKKTPVSHAASGCVQFAGTTPNGAFIQGCNMDLPFKRLVPDSIQVQLQTRQPEKGIPHCIVGVTGMAGTIGGFNSCGLCITSCTLLDYPTPFQIVPNAMEHATLTQKILSECTNIDQAIKLIYQNGAIGGWTMAISEGVTGNIAQVEYCDKLVIHRENIDFLAQANHSQLLVKKYPQRGITPPEHSVLRERRLRQILTNDGTENGLAVDALSAFSALRDVKSPFDSEFPTPGSFRTINMILRVDNVCSWMFNHTAQTLTVACTPDIYVSEDDKALWEEIPVRDLLPDYNPVKEAVTVQALVLPTQSEVKPAAVEKSVQQETDFAAGYQFREIPKFTVKEFMAKVEQANSAAGQMITKRYINCLVESPALPEIFAPKLGKALIIGAKNNPVVAELKDRLAAQSVDSVIFELVNAEGGKSEETIASEIDAIWKTEPVYNIYIASCWDSVQGYAFRQADWLKLQNELIQPLYLTLRQIYKNVSPLKTVDKLRITAGTCLGGDGGHFGFSDHIEGGAIAGLLHNLHMENFATFNANTSIKTVDFSRKAQGAQIASRIIAESAFFEFQSDICYQGDTRYILTLVPEITPLTNDSTGGGVWLVTGGARGVTAELAYALARRDKAKLYIIGSSPLPQVNPQWRNLDAAGLKELKQAIVRQALADKKKPANEWARVEKALEIDRNMRRLDEAGVSWEYYSCDLSSYSDACNIVKKVLDIEGKIDGVLHGAGFEKSGTFYKKEAKNARLTADVKVGGLWAILETLSAKTPRYIIMMGSAAGRLGGNGQTDYGMSNYLSAKMLNRFAMLHPQCRAVTFHWNAWGEVGMSVRPESLIAFKAIGMEMMPVKEGCNHFFNELTAPAYQAEITPLPEKLYQDACRYTALFEAFEASENSAKNVTSWVSKASEKAKAAQKQQTEEKPVLSIVKPESEPQSIQDDSFITSKIFGNNVDANVLKRFAVENNIEPPCPILMVCRDECLSKFMTKAQLQFRKITIESPAKKQAMHWKELGFKEILVPTSDSIDPVTQEFISVIESILPVKLIKLPWSLPPEESAKIILRLQSAQEIPEKKAPPAPQEVKRPLAQGEQNSAPAILNNICLLNDEAIQTECLIDPVKDTFLQQHQLKGRPIVPIVMGLEIIAETAKTLSVKCGVGELKRLENVKIVRGVSCALDVPYRLVCVMEKTDSPCVWNVLVKGDFYNKAGKKINENCPYYRCQAVFSDDNSGKTVNIQSELKKSIEMTYPKLGERPIYHGPALQTLKACRFNDDTVLVGEIVPHNNTELISPARAGEPTLYPAVLDACLYACGVLHSVSGDLSVIVPDQFERIEFGSGQITENEKCNCCAKRVKTIDLPGGYRQVVFDFTLYSAAGEMVVNVNNYCSTIVSDPK